MSSEALHFSSSRRRNPMPSEKALKTKQSLLLAAKDIIVSDGINFLTMDNVAAKAGISKGACMYHFKSKRDLQIALLEHYASHLEEELVRHEALFEGKSENVLISGFVEWFKSFDRNNHGWAIVGMALLSNFYRDEEIIRPVKQWYARLHERIASLPEEKRIRTLVAVMAMEGFFYTHKLGLDLASPELKVHAWDYLTGKSARP